MVITFNLAVVYPFMAEDQDQEHDTVATWRDSGGIKQAQMSSAR